ncbi:restriction endonuclease subunit S [Myroides odoratimimus]|uniref:restriction endonuclease subunit S n=1 Tax=Myroides odoratimimus TaxID=76832 RepID=UPI002575712A|nr:restriction endonuclease subunit S [Myroides odoratimimus]
MQQLFAQQLRFKDDNGNNYPDWQEKTLGEVAICLNNVRKPLNGIQRNNMKGIYPYWGANNIVDYVNDYVVDDEIVLLAEDGGNFHEFKEKPIANYFIGKCWVNNHTHILKGTESLLTKYLFYTLQHKDITHLITGGTRTKLTKASMLEIRIDIPSLNEQTKIANFLSALDNQIEAVENQITKTETYKKGLLQQMFV